MQLTNGQADMLFTQLNTIYTSLVQNQKPAPCVVTFGLAKNIRKCQAELKEYYTEKQKLLDKYNIKTNAQLQTDNGKKFLEEFNPLSEEICDVELHKLKMTFDELCDAMEIYTGTMIGDPMALQFICKDDEETKEGE